MKLKVHNLTCRLDTLDCSPCSLTSSSRLIIATFRLHFDILELFACRMADSFTAFPGRRPFGTKTVEQSLRVCSYGHLLPAPRKYDYLDIAFNRTEPLWLARDQGSQYPKKYDFLDITSDRTAPPWLARDQGSQYLKPKRLEPYGVCKECDRIHGLNRDRMLSMGAHHNYYLQQQARSKAAASQNPLFPNYLRTRPRSDVPPLAPYQREPPWAKPTTAGGYFGPINPVQPPASGGNNNFSDTASATSTAFSSRPSHSGRTNPTTNRQNHQVPYPFEPPARRRTTDFSDTASIFSTTSSSSRSTYPSWDRA